MALEGMGRTWSRTGDGKRPKIDGDFRKVVMTRLGDGNGQVVMGALKAARMLTAGKKAHAKTVERILKLSKDGPANRRAAAIDALVNVRGCQIPRASNSGYKAKCVAVMLTALDAKETFLVATAVNRLARAAFPKIPRRDDLATVAKRLHGHKDPGVRGLAVLLAARVATPAEKKDVAARIRKLLTDSNAFTRAVATDAAAALGDAALIHDVIGRLDDAGLGDYSVRGFKALDGSPGRVRLRIEDLRVDIAALRALKALSGGKFKYKRPAGAKRSDMRLKAISDARAWYQTAKAKLPKVK